MGAATTNEHDRSDFLNAIGWALSLIVLIAVSVLRATRHDGDASYQAGRAFGAVVISLLIAFAIGLVIQRLIRKRRGFPWWLGAIAVGISLLVALADAGRRTEAQASERCTVGAHPYGAPPDGLRYVKASAQIRKNVARLVAGSGQHIRDYDVSMVVRDGKEVAFMFALPDPGPGYLQGGVDQARELGAPSRYASIGSSRVLIVGDSARMVMGKHGCLAYAVNGFDPQTVDAIANRIFK